MVQTQGVEARHTGKLGHVQRGQGAGVIVIASLQTRIIIVYELSTRIILQPTPWYVSNLYIACHLDHFVPSPDTLCEGHETP